ncbi:hypothetical protein SLEP1_g46980 [Rubroshorea leprosula]|uniref:DUF4283 domain-containing protein n=1 Tax=Rubroshorea leprosula TaxID=152421 RepID=A0AAV5LRJ8_9ROSI|nr:hypothetical protein SLEP1_g46980 [Rubroshorea leprosula]
MQVREAIKIFSSPQETDLLGRSVKKIKGAESVHSLGEAPMMEANVQPREANSFPGEGTVNVTMVDVAHTGNGGETQDDTNMSEGDGNQETRGPMSYKDKLTGSENPVAISFSTIPAYMDEDSDVDDDPNDDSHVVLLSKAEKQRIRAPWMNALIVEEDLHRVIFGGPWFVGPYFMTLRKWEPPFVPSKALQSFTTTVWAQLPNLFADYYDPSTLQKIGNKVGNLL